MSEPYIHVRPVQLLKFERYPGLEVRCKSGSVRQYLAVAGVAASAPAEIRPGDVEGMAAIVELAETFADVLIDWNYTEQAGDGEPESVPANKDGLLGMDYPMLHVVIDGWLSAVAGIADPLEQPSSSGDTQPEVFIPTEALSGSQPS